MTGIGEKERTHDGCVGVVVSVKEAFGFIMPLKPAKHSNLFFHVSEVIRFSPAAPVAPGAAKASLHSLAQRGDEVRFRLIAEHHVTGKPAAVDVKVASPGSLLRRYEQVGATVIAPLQDSSAPNARRVDAYGGELLVDSPFSVRVRFTGQEISPSLPRLRPNDRVQLTLLHLHSTDESDDGSASAGSYCALDVQPFELYGFVHRVMRSYGFILTAKNYPGVTDQCFFHVTMVSDMDPRDLEQGMEVAFTLSNEQRSGSKLSAHTLRPLPAGTIERQLGQTYDNALSIHANAMAAADEENSDGNESDAQHSQRQHELGEPQTGIVKILKESYGFIKSAKSDNSVFFHFNTVSGDANKLEVGSEVVFRVSGTGKNCREVAGQVDVVVYEDEGTAIGTCTQEIVLSSWRDTESGGASGLIRMDDGPLAGEEVSAWPDLLLSKSDKVSEGDVVEAKVRRNMSTGERRLHCIACARRSGFVRRMADKNSDPPTPGEIEVDSDTQLGPSTVAYIPRAVVGLKPVADGARVEFALARDDDGMMIARSVRKARVVEGASTSPSTNAASNATAQQNSDKQHPERRHIDVASNSAENQLVSPTSAAISHTNGTGESQRLRAVQAHGPDGTHGFNRHRQRVPKHALPVLLQQPSVCE